MDFTFGPKAEPWYTATEGIPIIAVNGSRNLMGGFTRGNSPRVVMQNRVRNKAGKNYDSKQKQKDQKQAEKEEFICPVVRGNVVDWESQEAVLNELVYNELRVSPEERYLLLADCLTAPAEQRQKLAQ